MSERNIEVVRRLLRANRSGPPEETRDVALSLTDSDVLFRSRITAVEGAEYAGHEGVHRYFEDLSETFEEWRNEPEEFAEVSPAAVLVDNAFRGVGKSSGMEVELRSAIVFVVVEEKVIRCLSYPTRTEALEAAGLSE